MARDAATDSVALLGILNGSVVLDGTAGEAYAVSRNARIRIGSIPGKDPGTDAMEAAGTFHDAVRILSEALAADPFSKEYQDMLQDASEGGSFGWLACSPVGGYWPDALLRLDPAAKIKDPANRCFPLYHCAAAVAEDLPEGSDMDGWCMENTDSLVFLPGGEGVVFFAGWCSGLGTVVRVPAYCQDFSKPWTVVKNADGSDYVTAAAPMVLADRALNAWLPPEELQELRNGN